MLAYRTQNSDILSQDASSDTVSLLSDQFTGTKWTNNSKESSFNA